MLVPCVATSESRDQPFAGGCVDTRKKVKLGSALTAVAPIIGRR
jgi:hypothetical protein